MDSLSINDTAPMATPAPPAKDLSHHFSVVTKARASSNIKAFYKFFQIPGISNLAGGMYCICITLVA